MLPLKQSYALFILMNLVLVGSGCASQNIQTPATSSTTPATAPSLSTTTTSSQTGWKTYTSVFQHFKIDVPSDWKIGEYVSLNDPNELVAVAFDPIRVLSQEEFNSLDRAPGRVWLNLNLFDHKTSSTSIKTIGPEKIQAAYTKTETGKNAPNPFWLNTVQETYNIPGPDYSNILLNTYYTAEEKKDTGLQETLKKIIQSFQLVEFSRGEITI